MSDNTSSKSMYPGEPTLLLKGGPDPATRGSEQHKEALVLVATLAEARQPAASLPLDFHQLDTASQSSNPYLRAMGETAHQLIDHNLVRSSDIAEVRLRHLDHQDTRVTEAIKAVSGVAAASATFSNYNTAKREITILEQDATRVLRANEGPDSSREFVFRHELGHAMHSSQDTADTLKKVSPELIPSHREANLEKVLYGEMRADVFALAATAVTKGNPEANRLANIALVSRELEHGEWFASAKQWRAGSTPYNDHHTTAAILEFKEQLAAGRFDKHQPPESFNQAISEIAAKGLQNELRQVPHIWLGAQQLGPDNQLTQASPEVRAALVESIRKNVNNDYRDDRSTVRLVMSPETARQVTQPGEAPPWVRQLEVQGTTYAVITVKVPATLSVPAQGDAPARDLEIGASSLGIVRAGAEQAQVTEKLRDHVLATNLSPQEAARSDTRAVASTKAPASSFDRER